MTAATYELRPTLEQAFTYDAKTRGAEPQVDLFPFATHAHKFFFPHKYSVGRKKVLGTKAKKVLIDGSDA